MDEFVINGQIIEPGQRVRIQVPVADLYSGTPMNIPVQVISARKPGPKLFVSAAVHGDELNGIEIIRRLMRMKSLKLTAGVLIAVPMVNVYGVLNQSRYLPDRRDLNRSFPGSPKGSLAARMADQFLNEIVGKCDYGIDLHTGAIHRSNLPQVRANLDDPETCALAEAFGAPVMLNANLRDGSLRQAAMESGTRILLYEAGEALRFDDFSINTGVRGVLKVMASLGMIRVKPSRRKYAPPFVASNSSWVRAESSGIVHNLKHLGDRVKENEPLAEIGTPFGEILSVVRATRSGVVIGKQNIPLVQEGEAMFHIAFFDEDDKQVVAHIENVQGEVLDEDPYPSTIEEF